jgi:hypothetical protein
MRQDVAQCDMLIIGAGVTGLYALYRLRGHGRGRGRHLVSDALYPVQKLPDVLKFVAVINLFTYDVDIMSN